ncbi:hypothetical protein M407DRAFT_20075 [Tulasnella calospora MUT 4182]|uniref:Calcineurin subunit B n=1 Tax=Tulasnella calospora MUT 4182 TaxID=1051891 RepID=A0A0C3MB48_9AGAM|nr:hypothetical protein M407DRAFT_20075 [Tulasnella calospora MUT 4182]
MASIANLSTHGGMRRASAEPLTSSTLASSTDNETESDTRDSSDTNTTADVSHGAASPTLVTTDSAEPLPTIAIMKPSTFYNQWELLPTLPPSASQFMDEMENTTNCTSPDLSLQRTLAAYLRCPGRNSLRLVNQHELDRLRKRFMKLDRVMAQARWIVEKFLQIPQIANNPLASRMIAIFDDDGGRFPGARWPERCSAVEADARRSYDISQASFPSYRAFFEECATLPPKVAFKVYDIDRDGYILNGELFFVLKMIVGNNVKDTQLQQTMDKTIIEANKDGDGKLSFRRVYADGRKDPNGAIRSLLIVQSF